jgi:putative hydrolases of HD superfamily
MQHIDPDDSRPKYVQIAASIRAAILTGEFPAGAQLPTGEELAESFGVTRATIQDAIRQLRDEGWVRSQSGSGVYVRGREALPVPEGTEHELAGVARFLFEMGHLKNTPRAGWLLLGVPNPESVADHSFRVAMVAFMLAAVDGADTGRAAALAIFHDGHETRIGDIPSVGRAYVDTSLPAAVTKEQGAGMPEPAAAALQGLTEEYEAGVSREARLARDADKIETLLQAAEYKSRGYQTDGWTETSLAALRTEAGRQLAQAIGAAGPLDWIVPFQASYHELRKEKRGHRPG